ncbi:chaperone NapD [Endozoicomonas lisbonensis]|uniref:Chaperone NapD n=1 Tax=Endozoicomonas lisbonensis TaxID=3120522 RepID=A0ABV2SNU9_9GAMM
MKHSNIDPVNDKAFTIAGLLVHTRPECCASVTEILNGFAGVEVHETDPAGKLVVTIEEQTGEKIMIDTISRINQTQGVMSAALVYSHQGTED